MVVHKEQLHYPEHPQDPLLIPLLLFIIEHSIISNQFNVNAVMIIKSFKMHTLFTQQSIIKEDGVPDKLLTSGWKVGFHFLI